MTNLIDQIKRKLPDGCLTNRLSKEGCTVKLNDAPVSSIKIDMDKLVGQNATKCDYIFIGGCKNVFLVPLELMKGKADATKIVRQLQAGADIAACRIIPKNKEVQFQPVAVCGKFHRHERDKLVHKSSRIHFRGERISIERLECGEPLTNAVDFC